LQSSSLPHGRIVPPPLASVTFFFTFPAVFWSFCFFSNQIPRAPFLRGMRASCVPAHPTAHPYLVCACPLFGCFLFFSLFWAAPRASILFLDSRFRCPSNFSALLPGQHSTFRFDWFGYSPNAGAPRSTAFSVQVLSVRVVCSPAFVRTLACVLPAVKRPRSRYVFPRSTTLFLAFLLPRLLGVEFLFSRYPYDRPVNCSVVSPVTPM